MTAATRLTVLIAHGEPLIQMGLEGALKACNDLQVQSMHENHFDLASFDVVITDLDSGLELARHASDSTRRVVIVTNDESEVGIRNAVEAGVRGYLLLNSTPDSVATAVRRVGSGSTAIDPRALSKMIDSLNSDKLTQR